MPSLEAKHTLVPRHGLNNRQHNLNKRGVTALGLCNPRLELCEQVGHLDAAGRNTGPDLVGRRHGHHRRRRRGRA